MYILFCLFLFVFHCQSHSRKSAYVEALLQCVYMLLDHIHLYNETRYCFRSVFLFLSVQLSANINLVGNIMYTSYIVHVWWAYSLWTSIFIHWHWPPCVFHFNPVAVQGTWCFGNTSYLMLSCFNSSFANSYVHRVTLFVSYTAMFSEIILLCTVSWVSNCEGKWDQILQGWRNLKIFTCRIY